MYHIYQLVTLRVLVVKKYVKTIQWNLLSL